MLAARRIERLNGAAADLAAAHGVRVVPLEVDLARPDAPTRLAADMAGIDVGLLVSNAGFSIKGDHAGNHRAAMTELLMVNCHAPVQLAHAFIPRLRARGRGGILFAKWRMRQARPH